MVWRRPGDKPLSEPMMLDDRRIYSPLGLNGEINEYNFTNLHPTTTDVFLSCIANLHYTVVQKSPRHSK